MTASRFPVFEGCPDHYAELGKMLDEIGLGRTAITVVPTLDKNPLDKDAAVRKAAVDYLKYCVDCTAALGADCSRRTGHQTLGHFSGKSPTDAERSRARERASQGRRLCGEAGRADRGRGGEPLRDAISPTR